MNDGGKPTEFATSSAAPLDDRLRTVHSTPLPPNAMVAPFRTLWRRADLFSIRVSIIVVIRICCAVLQGLPRRDYGPINPTGSINADEFSIGLR
jgi:hypothetical protein